MLGANYYHGLIRKYVTVVGTLFNDLVVRRFDKDGNRIQSISVPLAYGPKQHWMVRLKQDPNLDKPNAIVLPRMGFEIIGLNYDGERKLNSTHKFAVPTTTDDGNTVKSLFVPVPYNFNFSVYIMSKNVDDGYQILEQIVPYFTPEFTAAVKLIPEFSDLTMNIPITLTDITIEDTYDTGFEERRLFMITMNLTLKGYLYGPVSSTGIIKQATTNLYATTNPDGKKIEAVVIQPGLTANGQSTTDSSESIPYQQIKADDPWGFCIDFYRFEE